MTCPDCLGQMTHQGYFDWDCAACGQRRKGDLPPRGDADGGDEDGPARH